MGAGGRTSGGAVPKRGEDPEEATGAGAGRGLRANTGCSATRPDWGDRWSTNSSVSVSMSDSFRPSVKSKLLRPLSRDVPLAGVSFGPWPPSSFGKASALGGLDKLGTDSPD